MTHPTIIEYENLKRKEAILNLLYQKKAKFKEIQEWISSNKFYPGLILNWLMANDYVKKEGDFFFLTPEGKLYYEENYTWTKQ